MRPFFPANQYPDRFAPGQFHFARQKFTWRRAETGLRGQNPLCAGHQTICAAIFRFARRESGLRGPSVTLRGRVSSLRGQNPVCAGVFHFARPETGGFTSFSGRRCIKRDIFLQKPA